MQRTKGLKRGRLRRVGKIGQANIEANQILKSIMGDVGYCEIGLIGCLGNWPLQFVHRHKRAWYKGDVAKLSDYRQVIVGCQNCHEKIEHDAELTKQVFNKLRGEE